MGIDPPRYRIVEMRAVARPEFVVHVQVYLVAFFRHQRANRFAREFFLARRTWGEDDAVARNVFITALGRAVALETIGDEDAVKQAQAPCIARSPSHRGHALNGLGADVI